MSFALTPRQALENRIRADARNIATWESMEGMVDRYKLSRLPYIVSDVACRWEEAERLGDQELLRAAELNLTRAALLWRVHNL